MQMFVSVLSTRRPALTGTDSAAQSLLTKWGYQRSGHYYFRQWPDPITGDTLHRIVGFSVEPSAVNMEGTNLDDGGILRISCTAEGDLQIAVMIDGYLDGGSDGDLQGIFRFDDQEPQESGNWSVLADWDGAIVPERQWSPFWQSMVSHDTLAVRFNDDSQDQYTYLFSLDGLSQAMNQTGVCGQP